MKEIAKVINVSKVYKTGDTTISALNPSSVSFYAGELVLIIGPSGSGKTTLLSILGCVTYPTSGEVYINGNEVSSLPESKLGKIRLENIGFVFQGYNLITPLNALQNVMLPLELMNVPAKEAKEKAIQALKKVTMEDRMKYLPRALSGGQQQRVAIARALVSNPSLILCDEPTASLDPSSVDIVMGELKSLVAADKCVVIVTHDMRLRPYADRIVYVDNGNVLTEEPKSEYAH